MKLFLLKTLVFIISITVFLTLYEFVLRQIPNDYSFKSKTLSMGSKIETLILGSSHSLRAIDPKYLTSNSFNAAYISQSLDIDLEILKEKINCLHNLKQVIVPISYQSLFKRLADGDEKWRLKNYSIYFNIPTESIFQTEIGTNKYDVNFTRLIDYYIKKKRMLVCDSNGWATFNNDMSQKPLEEDSRQAVARHTQSNLDPILQNTLYEFSSFCDNRNIKLVLVSLPVSKNYFEKINQQQWQITQDIVNKISSQFEEIIYLDYFQHPYFNKDDFYNSDHLNRNGAHKISELIDLNL